MASPSSKGITCLFYSHKWFVKTGIFLTTTIAFGVPKMRQLPPRFPSAVLVVVIFNKKKLNPEKFQTEFVK